MRVRCSDDIFRSHWEGGCRGCDRTRLRVPVTEVPHCLRRSQYYDAAFHRRRTKWAWDGQQEAELNWRWRRFGWVCKWEGIVDLELRVVASILASRTAEALTIGKRGRELGKRAFDSVQVVVDDNKLRKSQSHCSEDRHVIPNLLRSLKESNSSTFLHRRASHLASIS